MFNYNQINQAYGYIKSNDTKINQIIGLYNSIIKNLNLARIAIEKNDIQEKYNTLSQALEVIKGLQNSLDFSQNNNLCNTLYKLYNRIYLKIYQIQKEESIDLIDNVINEVQIIKDAWSDIKNN